MTNIDIEKLISGCEFPNPDHKRRLRERLFGETRELDLNELDAAAGGYALTESSASENTPERQENSDTGWIEWPVPKDKPE